ncbi:MAG: TonB-dependent receptor [Chitinophagales bacterium]
MFFYKNIYVHGFCLFLLIFMCNIFELSAQEKGTVRGIVYNKEDGEPVIFTNVILKGTTYGSSTNINGLYSITDVPVGNYTLFCTGIGYDTTTVQIRIEPDKITSQNLYLGEQDVKIKEVSISAKRQEAVSEVQVSTIQIEPKLIKQIPSVGGEPDISQFLQVLPGVVFTGDQGGQLYIRGGSPIQTKVLLDGVTIYNPFHSIGFFSVFETDIIRSVDVVTGGFNAEQGGRISALIDIKTKDGNKKEHDGKISLSPFMAKAVFEGPLKRQKENSGASITYLLTGKYSILDRTSEALYPYVNEGDGIPFQFRDFYGKLSFNFDGGSRLSLFGFNFHDVADFKDVARYEWNSLGFGTNFSVVPGKSSTIIDGFIAYSNYDVELREAGQQPRSSSIGGFNIGMNFTYFLRAGEVKYGLAINGFSTDYRFFNSIGTIVEQNQNTTELGAFVQFKKIVGKFVLEPGVRFDYYASLGTISPEPRLGIKYNALDKFRIKLAGGVYAQNFISTKADRDVVNLFNGFLSAPDERLTGINGVQSNSKLQRAYHAILGFEVDVTRFIEFTFEPYYKRFGQLININRNKLFPNDPDFMIETGNAYGTDFLVKYDYKNLFIWAAYSLSWVDRNDGNQTYPPHFDRRHNLNLTTTYTFGKGKNYEVSARWNLGSGFPFTRTQAFYEDVNFNDGINTNYAGQNGDLGILYEEELNAGRLPYYHRLDFSLKATYALSVNTTLDIVASVTNAYNRNNIFYFDRVRYERIDQLPVLPSLGVSLSF